MHFTSFFYLIPITIFFYFPGLIYMLLIIFFCHDLYIIDRFFRVYAIFIGVTSVFKGIEIALCQNLFGFVQMRVVIFLGLYLGIVTAAY